MSPLRILLAGCLLAAAPLALAQAPVCRADMGAGWPAATSNYGDATVNLLGGAPAQGLSWLVLPKRGEEHQLTLAPDAQGQWWVIRGRADQRIHYISNDRNSFGVQLRLDQEPEIDRAPIPAELAQRIVAHWERVLPDVQMAERAPVMGEEDIFSLLINGQRYSGRQPGCSLLSRLLDQRALLEELAGSKEKRHEKRYEAIGRALDKYDEHLAEGKV